MGSTEAGVESPTLIGGNDEKIFVSVRLRPLNGKEIARNDVSDWECVNDNTVVYNNANLSVTERSMYPTSYTFGNYVHQLHPFCGILMFQFV